jgi:hypothetical protein
MGGRTRVHYTSSTPPTVDAMRARGHGAGEESTSERSSSSGAFWESSRAGQGQQAPPGSRGVSPAPDRRGSDTSGGAGAGGPWRPSPAPGDAWRSIQFTLTTPGRSRHAPGAVQAMCLRPLSLGLATPTVPLLALRLSPRPRLRPS